MTATAEPTKTRLSLDYWRLWTASVVSNLGDGIAQIAYPWLASAVTRDPLLIALIALAQRIPWLLFTLPAGVITDRVDRRKIMVAMDVVRALLTTVVALVILGETSSLPTPAELATGVDVATNFTVYLALLAAALLMGMAEVLRDNTAQTFMPALVKPEQLEKANGNLWGAEMVANSFIGPPLGSILLGIGFALPFFIDAGTFAVAAGLVFLITGQFRARRADGAVAPRKVAWRAEIKEGFMWLWRHPLLRPMAIILGMINATGMMTWSTFILFAQEDLDLETGLLTGVLQPVADFFGASSVAAFVFSLLLMAGAVGGILGSVFAARISKRLGSGPSLYLTLAGLSASALVIGLTSRWWVVWIMFAMSTLLAILWNVITVSLRQTIIPDELLGRVNSVYRFFAWGMMPVGSLLGGLIAAGFTPLVGRADALRWPFFAAAILGAGILVYAFPRLTTEKIEGARAAASQSAD